MQSVQEKRSIETGNRESRAMAMGSIPVEFKKADVNFFLEETYCSLPRRPLELADYPLDSSGGKCARDYFRVQEPTKGRLTLSHCVIRGRNNLLSRPI